MRNKCRNKCNKMPASDFIQQMNLWMKNFVFSLSKILIMRLDFFHYLKKNKCNYQRGEPFPFTIMTPLHPNPVFFYLTKIRVIKFTIQEPANPL